MYVCVFLVLFVWVASALDEDNGQGYGPEKGFGVGIVYKPPNCKRVTKHGDHISVKYNGTLVDGRTYVPTV